MAQMDVADSEGKTLNFFIVFACQIKLTGGSSRSREVIVMSYLRTEGETHHLPDRYRHLGVCIVSKKYSVTQTANFDKLQNPTLSGLSTISFS